MLLRIIACSRGPRIFDNPSDGASKALNSLCCATAYGRRGKSCPTEMPHCNANAERSAELAHTRRERPDLDAPWSFRDAPAEAAKRERPLGPRSEALANEARSPKSTSLFTLGHDGYRQLVTNQLVPSSIGSSQSSATVPPNIDLYLLLDNSPSMAIAATSSGISTMVANTPDQCAFGCHESDTSPNDYYGLARSLGVTLRMDLLTQAVQNLMGTAQSTASTNNSTYRAGIYTFNISFNTITTLTSSLSVAQSQAANIQLYEVRRQASISKCRPTNSFPPLAIGRFFLFSGEAALAAISESDAQLIVGPPHHVAGAAVAIGRPEPELVRDRVCPDAGKLGAVSG
jgi:hypothetical protein